MRPIWYWCWRGRGPVLLGAIFFGGLWWTVRKSRFVPRPALWFLGSLLLRMSITLAGFYLVSDGHWERLLACLLGFVMRAPSRDCGSPARRSTAQTRPAKEASHAP
jgi:F1F0 ATPase subunit 2